MAATVTVNSVKQVYAGESRMNVVNISVSGTIAGTEALSAASCRLNAILYAAPAFLWGTAGYTTGENSGAVAVLSTAGVLSFFNSNGASPGGLLKNVTIALNGTITGDILVIGN